LRDNARYQQLIEQLETEQQKRAGPVVLRPEAH
jgi:hypothetical protein